ncbi:MAG: MBL fold metallo-hydrolase [Bacilli bacterium]|nr:MBL fold metallo-hydrolase [Bacilli bacterium]
MYEKNNDKEIGDWLIIKGEQENLSFVTLESEFNFTEYLNDKGVYKQFNVHELTYSFRNPIRTKKVRNNFLAHFDDDTSDLYNAILFSTSGKGELTTSLRKYNLSRLISFGGIYLYGFINYIESKLRRKFSEKQCEIISTSILVFYSIFTFPKFTPIKILTIRIIRLINKYLLNDKFTYEGIIGSTGIIFLLLNVNLAKQDSFILGYLIPINNIFVNALYPNENRPKYKIFKTLWLYFFFIPFELAFNNSTNFLAFLLQFIISPLFIFSGILGLLAFFKLPIYIINNLFTKLIVWILKAVPYITFSIHLPPFALYMIPIYYLCYYVFMYYFQIRYLPYVKFLAIGYTVILITYILPIKNTITQEVSFINVGQGDCCLIRDGNTTVLMDTGGLTYKDLASSSLIPYFKSKRLYKIDAVILSHDDYDHSGALESLQENFKVGNVYRDYSSFPLQIGDIEFKNYNIFYDSQNDENTNSLVIGFSLFNKDFLITGDAPIEVEKKIMEEFKEIPCDILKVGHHGSNTSTSDMFIKYLKPTEGVISVGKNNKYKHPNDSVIRILKENNVEIKRTDILGTITYSNYKFL